MERTQGFVSNVRVIVRGFGSDGEVAFEETIDRVDMWVDVEHRYHALACTDTEARLGPKYWDGEMFTDYVLERSAWNREAR